MTRRQFITSSVASSLVSSVAAADDKKLRVVIIGHTGRGNYGHGIDTMWLKVPAVEIVGVADADAKGLAAELFLSSTPRSRPNATPRRPLAPP